MKKFALFCAFALAAVPAFAQDADAVKRAEEAARRAEEAAKRVEETAKKIEELLKKAQTGEAARPAAPAAPIIRPQVNPALTQLYSKVRDAIAKKDFEAAEKALADLQKETGSDAYVNSSIQMLANAYIAAGNMEKGGEYALKQFENMWNQATRSQPAMENMSRQFSFMAEMYKKAGKADAVLAKIDETIKQAAATGRDRVLLLSAKARALGAFDRAADAQKVIAEVAEAAEKDFVENPKIVANVLAKLDALDLMIENLRSTNSDRLAEVLKSRVDFVKKAIADFPKEIAIIEKHVNAELADIRELADNQLKSGEERIAALSEMLGGVSTDDRGAQSRVTMLGRMLDSAKRSLAARIKMAELIGKPAAPFDGEIEAWVNGSQLKDSDLKGKVVLVDFWAVWCGPCIATFPHLREWNEKYAKEGLVIIGATKHYKYDWDDEKKAIKRDESLAKDKEQAAMVRFAGHHELKHVFAVQTDESKLDDFYGVTGIPTAVVIDRDGKVKMIRVGSGEKNAHDLEGAIREALGLGAK